MLRNVAMVGLLGLGACVTAPRSVQVVPFVVGTPVFDAGDDIEIEEIVGTLPRLEVGGVYVVSGRAKVVSHDGARLALYSTGMGNEVRTKGYQSAVVPKGESEFHLAVAILGDGDLHLMLSPVDDLGSTKVFGGVYFRDPARPFLYGGVEQVDTAR